MKAQISRISHDPSRAYSGVFHVQGGLITDADLNEGATILRDRGDLLGRDAIRSGAPAQGGIADLSGAPLRLVPGTVYALGLRGTLAASSALDPARPLDLLFRQADLPGIFDPATVTTEQIVYADLWHRPVSAAEDARLAEVALHGAAPSFRTKVVAQLKLAPVAKAGAILSQTADFPALGTGTLAVGAITAAETGNTCDPCATDVNLDARIGNALFRIEVIDVAGPANAPTSVALAWSLENAAETAGVDALPTGFTDGTHVYEHFDSETENHKGVFATPSLRRKSEFLAAVNPAHSRKLVRRWDGHARFAMAGTTVTERLGMASTANATVNAGKVTLRTELFEAVLTLTGKAAVAGDFWLIELRENALKADGTPDPFRVVSVTPLGIVHHTAPLFRIANGAVQPLTSAERRALSFPALSDLPASHVSYQNTCAKLYGSGATGATTVQQALDALCGIDATDIAWTNICPDTFGTASTVAEALNALCGIGKDVDLTWMKYVFDWGVLCGLKVTLLSPEKLGVSPGAWLDWTGTFAESPWKKDLILTLGDTTIDQDIKIADEAGVCFGLEIVSDKEVIPVIGPDDSFGRESDATFEEKLIQCRGLDAKSKGLFAAVFKKLNKAEAELLRSTVTLAASGGWTASAAGMTADEGKRFGTILDVMQSVYRKEYGERAAEQIEAAVAAILKEEGGPDRLPPGVAQDQMRLQQASRITNVYVAAVSDGGGRDCACDALFPDCPEDKKPVRIPLARLFFSTKSEVVRVCMVTCRKQALTPRTIAHYLREEIHALMLSRLQKPGPQGTLEKIAELCCQPPGTSGTSPKVPLPWKYRDEPVIRGAPRPVPKYYEVDGLPRLAAEEMIKGNGLDIAVVIDIDQRESLGQIETVLGGPDDIDRLVDSRNLAAAGDRVALLVDGKGTARGLLRVAEGSGRYPFEPAPRAVKDVRDAPDGGLAAIEARAKSMEESIAVAGATLAGLNDSIAKAREEIAGLSAERGKMVAGLRAEQPVAVVVGRSPEAVAGWAALGVATLGDLAGLDDARMAQAVKEKLSTRAEVQALREAARTRIGG